MNELNTRNVQCPYCGEIFEVLIDGSVPHQKYIEDCEVCCRPINFDITVDQTGDTVITVTNEDE